MISWGNRSDIPFLPALPLAWPHEFSLFVPLFSFSDVQVLKVCIKYKEKRGQITIQSGQ